ncbi:MAG: BlaR1 family beta-lactam sensor/signal transducer [Clostridium sp.]
MNLPFFIRLIISSTALSLIILFIHFIKKKLKKHITTKTQYYIWFVFLILLTTPFISIKNFENTIFTSWLPRLNTSTNIFQGNGEALNSTIEAQNSYWLKDFSVTPNTTFFESINFTLCLIWIVGMIIVLAFTIVSFVRLQSIKASLLHVEDKNVNDIFLKCKKQMGINKTIKLKSSHLVESPIILGLFNPVVVIPMDELFTFSQKEVEYILLHELQHYKNKDILMNYILCIFQIIYWFNPLVWKSIKEMKIDREVACDMGVLHSLNEEEHFEYGNTIISFADRYFNNSPFITASDIGGGKAQIKRRIIEIASFKKASLKTKINSIIAISLLSIFVFSLIPLLSVRASDDSKYYFESNNVEYIDLSSYFNNIEGSFVLYDPSDESFKIYNEEVSEKRVSPNSTYKIYSALFALENNIISKENSTLPWDGEVHGYEEWNSDQNLDMAIKNSTSWYFRRLDSLLGLQKVKAYLKYLNYGNYDVSGGIENFWTQSSLKISPIEQVQLLDSLFSNDFMFNSENIEIIKNSLLITSSNGVSIYGKTGTGSSKIKGSVGWFIGCIEVNGKPYYFSTNLLNNENATSSQAIEITKKILQLTN